MDGVVPATDETFAGIAREASRLRRLAGDLSALSASSELTVLIGTEPVDVGELIADVVDLLRVQAEAKQLELGAHSEPGCLVAGDRDRLIQVVTNVIGNAIQYTDEGSIVVSVDRSEADIAVTVTDTGRGIAADDLSRIFERFYRVDEHYTDGSGVGLAIAQSLTRAHKGTLSATSPGETHGATFTLRLPAVI